MGNEIARELNIREKEMFLKVKEKIEGKVVQEVFEKAGELENMISPLPALKFKEINKMKKKCTEFIITLGILESTRHSDDFKMLEDIFEESEIVEIMEKIKWQKIILIIAVGVFIGIAVAGIVLYLITKFIDFWEGK